MADKDHFFIKLILFDAKICDLLLVAESWELSIYMLQKLRFLFKYLDFESLIRGFEKEGWEFNISGQNLIFFEDIISFFVYF